MKTFKFFLNEKTQNKISIRTIFGTQKQKKENDELEQPKLYYNANFTESVEGEDIVVKPHTDKESKKFHENNRVSDESMPKNMLSKHLGWLNQYSDYSKQMNDALYDHYHNKKIEKTQFNDEERHQRNLTFAHETEKVLAKNRTNTDHTFFSGINSKHAEKLKNQNKPIQAHHAGFISSSTDFNQAAKFTDDEEKHVLRIHAPKGTRAGSLMYISNKPREKEVLIQRGHDLEIHHEPTIINHPKHGLMHVWHAKIVGHNPTELNTKPLNDVLYSHEKT